MNPVELLQALLQVADAADLEVRVVGRLGGGEFDTPQASAICRVKGKVWVVLASGDPPAKQVEVLTEALKTHAGPYLEEHFVPPAVREHLG